MTEIQRVTPQFLREHPLPEPEKEGDKKERGRVLVIAGSVEVPGAAVLAGLGALRAGGASRRRDSHSRYAGRNPAPRFLPPITAETIRVDSEVSSSNQLPLLVIWVRCWTRVNGL